MDIKVPTSKEEMDALRKSLVQELNDDDLDTVAGGSGQKSNNTFTWTCPYCGAVLQCERMQDAGEHMTKECPKNPFG